MREIYEREGQDYIQSDDRFDDRKYCKTNKSLKHVPRIHGKPIERYANPLTDLNNPQGHLGIHSLA